jgi:hypothetical protein
MAIKRTATPVETAILDLLVFNSIIYIYWISLLRDQKISLCKQKKTTYFVEIAIFIISAYIHQLL